MNRNINTLIFIESEDKYSVYADVNGDEVYLEHGTSKRLLPFDDLLADLLGLWRDWTKSNYVYGHDAFREHLASLTIEPEEVETVKFCFDCNEPEHEDDMNATNGDNLVCDHDYRNYSQCYDCSDRYQYLYDTMSGVSVCDDCRDNGFSWCDYCDGYYRDRYHDDHTHHDDDDDEDDGCCESPAQSFSIRNDGDEPLANDTRTTVTLPAGVISDEGIGQIARFIREAAYGLEASQQVDMANLSYRLGELGERWQTKEGNYTKRLSRMAYKAYSLKLAPEVVSQVGSIASDHSTAVDFEIATTRNLNLPREEFAHSGSCWWTDYRTSRCSLKTNGGFGLRTFGESSGWGNDVRGRAWVMPLRLVPGGDIGDDTLTPTFDTLTPDAFVVFNGYGDLDGYKPARILSHMSGWTYRKVVFECEPMYVNNDSGYLVAPEEIAEVYTDGTLRLRGVDYHSDLFADETEKELTNV